MSIKLLVANWKMNGTLDESLSYFETLTHHLSRAQSMTDSFLLAPESILFCPSYPYLLPLQGRLIEHGFSLGAQDCSPHQKGAYTGDVSASMLKDVGATHVLIGHSERRLYGGDTNTLCHQKIQQAHRAGLITLYCVGETLQDRSAGHLEDILRQQLQEGLPKSATPQNTFIAYEPLWAIGTGQTPSLEDIRTTHTLIHQLLLESPGLTPLPVLYGGSVTPSNAEGLMNLPEVAGALVGGASLDPQSMVDLIRLQQKEARKKGAA